MKMEFTKDQIPLILVESSAYEGVRRIAGKVAEDIRKVSGFYPQVVTEREFAAVCAADVSAAACDAAPGGELGAKPATCRRPVILCATLGKSPILDALSALGLVDTACLCREDGSRKWEVYQIRRLSLSDAAQSDAAAGTCSAAAGTRNAAGSYAAAKSCAEKVSRGGAPALPAGIGQLLVICGSDKRGTIYGMFSLSEYIGVSPLCFWGDAEPAKRQIITIGEDIEAVSKEPSVKYRGFFINDEWPCFGNWVMRHFGGFNAQAYETVFELLLRLRGNYLWPAMWSASFPLDGPGSANEELADIYGVVMGYSHHEPCLRASEEWDKVRGEGTRYGNEWNFYTNEQGLINYWEDALKRSGRYENIITVGMRGERDTSMLGPEATVTENVNLLKRIITKQRELIDRYVERESGEVPMLLALYKEVEPYFYGDEKTPGLKDWDGLDGVTCMLCEDNYGYVRTLPAREIRGHKGGFGMYYHLDYHGAPISHEWVDSTPFSKIWEQMGEVYEYGVRDVWIVNVGDLKFHETSLAYFLALAYDYEKWGYPNPDSYRQYTAQWAAATFPEASAQLQEQIGDVMTSYIRVNGLRRPEALHAGIYHPCHYGETERMLDEAERVEKLSSLVLEELPQGEKDAYYSMIHFPAMASMNLLKMHLYAGKNHRYAAQGRVAANEYGRLVKECIEMDRAYAREWAAFRNGKWSGMEMEAHIGFTRWNEDDSRMPVTMEVTPVAVPRMSVSRADEERTATKTYGPPMVVRVPDFTYAGCETVELEIANGGAERFSYEITVESVRTAGVAGKAAATGADGNRAADAAAGNQTAAGTAGEGETGAILPSWLSVFPVSGEVEILQKVTLACDRSLLPADTETVRLIVKGGDARVAVEISGRAVPGVDGRPAPETAVKTAGRTAADHTGQITEAAAESTVCSCQEDNLPAGTFLAQNGVTVIDAAHYCRKKDTAKGQFRTITDYGKYSSGMKVFPSTAVFTEEEERPELTYRFLAESAGEYVIELLTAPANPLMNGKSVAVTVSCAETVRAELIPADFRSGDFNDGRWAAAALDQERGTKVRMMLQAGVQELTVGALEAGVVLERLRIYRADVSLKPAYLGQQESCCISAQDSRTG